MSELLKVNLLPEGLRKHTPAAVEQLHRTPLMRIALAIMVGLPILWAIPLQLAQHQLSQLNGKIQQLQPKKAAMDQLQHQLQTLRAQETAFRSLTKGEHLWSKRLNVLSDVLPEGVWFTELDLDETKGLVIQGSALSQAGPEMNAVNRLVDALKKDPDFSAAVKDIQIESLKRVQEDAFEVVQFTLICTLAEPPSPS